MRSKLLVSLMIGALGATASGCATIVAKSSQTITITSVPDGAAVNIANAAGTGVHSGNTPMTVTLKKGRGYFKPEHYTVRINKEGFQPQQMTIDGAVNGWYFGNIVFGGLIGMLAVDPSTGAMYTLKPNTLTAALASLKVSQNRGERTLTVMLTEDVPVIFRDQLVPIGRQLNQ
jgi:hypothetical protein